MTDMRPGEGGAGRPAGWFYVGDGRLRYRDEHGWTEFFMDTKDPRARSWPPAPPRELMQQLHDDLRVEAPHEVAVASAPRHGLLHRTRRRRRPR